MSPKLKTIKEIENNFQQALLKDGVMAEVTFCRDNMFSVLVDSIEEFIKAKGIISIVSGAIFDGEDCDPECGNIAYYKF
jgi:hypothetical protein